MFSVEFDSSKFTRKLRALQLGAIPEAQKKSLYKFGFLNKKKLKKWQSLISYVPQNNFLFSESIKKNIEFGNPSSSIDDITNAAKLAEVDLEIEKFENGYNTILGERGVTLSGGQAQRISIARSFIKDSEIYLFDDCFSSLDSDTEDRILKNLKPNYKNENCQKPI